MTSRKRFSGIYPIVYAFFNSDGTLDSEAIKFQVNCCTEVGAHGIVVLGIVTEVNKLDVTERQQTVEWIGEAVNGRVPYGVTCAEPSINGQVEFACIAKQNGADFVIFQPPLPCKNYHTTLSLRLISDTYLSNPSNENSSVSISALFIGF